MNKYLTIGALGFFMGMKYRQWGRRNCICFLKKHMHRMMRMMP